MKEIFNIANKRIIVTGGMGCLGRTIVELFLQQGAKVSFTDIISSEKPNNFRDDLINAQNSRYFQCNITDPTQVDSMVDRACDFLGGLDALVNTAAAAELVFAEDLSDDQWTQTVSVSLFGSFYSCRSAFRYLKDRGGAIVNTASIAGIIGLPRGTTHHSAAKAGVIGMTRSLALEWAKYGIRVNSIAPGQFDTDPLRMVMSNPEASKSILGNIPLGRIGTPLEVAKAILYLISDDASFITGHTLVMDGGTTVS